MKMKSLLLCMASLAIVLPLVSSCNEESKSEKKTDLSMPSSEFGKTMSEIQESESSSRGFTVSKSDDCHLTLTKQENGAEVKYVYSFDPVTNVYRYAKGTYADANQLTSLTKQIGEEGYSLQANSNGVVYYVNADQKSIVVNTEKKEFFAIPASDEALAWGRFSNLAEADKAGLMVPYLGKYASVELVQLNEQFNGNVLDESKSNIANGVYVYTVKANDKGYTQLKYWFDVETKTKLEEAAVYFDAEKRPSTTEVEKYMNHLGLKYTALTDPSDGSSIYYNYEEKYEAYVLMNKPEDSSKEFTPNIHFAFTNLDNQVPPAEVTMPELVLDFGTMTLDEALEQYRSKPYFKGTEDDGFGGALGIIVTTSSPDFQKILLMDDGGKYVAAILMPDDAKVLRSPALKDWFAANNYTYAENISVLPTYISADEKVMAQFDLEGTFTGVPCLAFQPTE